MLIFYGRQELLASKFINTLFEQNGLSSNLSKKYTYIFILGLLFVVQVILLDQIASSNAFGLSTLFNC